MAVFPEVDIVLVEINNWTGFHKTIYSVYTKNVNIAEVLADKTVHRCEAKVTGYQKQIVHTLCPFPFSEFYLCLV